MTQIDTRPEAAIRAEIDALPAPRKFTNFTKRDKLEVSPHFGRISKVAGPIPALVSMHTHEGCFSFQLDMKPEQARELGRYLIECADALDALEGQQ